MISDVRSKVSEKREGSGTTERRPHVLFDKTSASLLLTGGKVYADGLANALRELAHYQVTSVCDKLPARRGGLWSIWNGIRHFIWMQVILPVKLLRQRADLLHSSSQFAPIFCPCPIVLTLFDTVHLMPVRRLNKLAPLVARFLINISVRRAAIICTISNVARSEIESIYRLAPGRIRVTYPGVSPRFEAAPETKVAEIRGKYGLSRPFFLYVGTWLPRKNLPRLIEAFRIFCNTTSTDYELILVGPRVAAPRGKTLELIRDVETAQNVRSLGFVPDEDMPGIYAASEALVFPSLSEGFGLPVIEAMACGTPVIVSGVSCLPEVAGDAALIINPEDPADIARAMNLVLDPGLRQELRQKGLERARFFTWENAALETEKAYTDALHRES